MLTPWIIFPVCEMHGSYVETTSGMKIPMACGDTARAETGLGALIVVSGGLLIARKCHDTRTGCRSFQYCNRGAGNPLSNIDYRHVQVGNSSMQAADITGP